jgi:tetratricopeptide (TPR) repeat protein
MTASPLDRGQQVVNAVIAAGGVPGGVIQAGTIDTVIVAAPGPGSEPPVPRQLPAPPRRFVNRAGELRALDDLAAAQDAPPVIIVLNGLSGVGKTALGLRWARANAHLFPGGQLHVDLSFYRRAGGVAVHHVLGGLLCALGVHEDFIPVRLAERAALFRSRTAAAPVLVFIDDADQAAQVRPLVPGAAGSAVIVTSRNRLSGLVFDDAEFIDISPLGEAEGMRMLSELIPRHAAIDHTESRALLAFCGGLPVAIRVAAARIARHGAAGLTDYLSAAETRLERLSIEERPMSHVLDTVAAGLPDRAGRLYRSIGAHPGPDFSVALAAAVADLDHAGALEALRGLDDAHLVERTGPDRFRLHDLIRLHAAKAARAEDASVLWARVEGWYLGAASAADLAIAGPDRWRLRPSGGGRPVATAAEAMAWYEAERANLIAVVRECADRRRDDAVLALCEALWPFYHGRRDHADWIEAHRLGVDAAVRAHDPLAEARMRNQLARAYIQLDRFAEAEAELADAATAAAAAGEPRARAVVLESEGVLALGRNRFTDAAAHFAGSLRINERIGDRRGTALECYHRADALVRGGVALEEAVALLERAMSTAEEIADETTAARASIVLGCARLRTGHPAQARQALERAATTMRRRGQPVKEMQALEVLADVASRTADHALAEHCAARLSALYTQTGRRPPA